ncbi:MAG: hypothetical protein ABIF01_05885 [Candidatus Micrarchaeota archaeon]
MDLENAFASTCKIIFGREIGKLADFETYLGEMMTGFSRKKSFASGKDVRISLPFYPEDARFISQDEVDGLKFEPLNINEIKDIDSLFSAVQERIVYCGNKVFGKNSEVYDVDNCIDCTHVSHASNAREVKYGAYLTYLRESEYVFGVWGFPESRMSIRVCEGVGSTRCFESYYSTDISDMYYSWNCIGCRDGIFAFNQRGKRNVIGNLELPREDYLELKKKLVSEIADELARKKKIFSISEVAFHGREKIGAEKTLYDSPVPEKIESAFSSTTKILLGKERKGIRGYSPWLLKRAMRIWKVRGASGSPTFRYIDVPVARDLPADRLLPLDEAIESGKKGIEIKQGETPSLNELLERVSKIAFFTLEFKDGQNENCVDTTALFGGSNIYKTWDTTGGSKNCAYTTGVIRSEFIFGGYLRILDSKFCINCFDPTKVSNSFEVDSSYTTRNSYLCHNIENADNCILCFNAKGLRNAVGNTVVGKEEFERIRKMLLERINGDLNEKQGTEISVFSVSR